MIFLESMANTLKLREELGFFFSCYKEDEAVKNCVKNIRLFYPENPIYLASDGGSNFENLQENDKNLKFALYEDKLGYVNHPETKDKEKLIDCCIEFLDRLKTAVDYCNKEFIIYYEPDVMIRDHVKIDKNLHINGSFANTIAQFVLDFIAKNNPNNKNRNFGSCGGSILRSSSFIDVYQKTDRDLIREMIYLDPRISNCDYLLTVLFSIHGYEYHRNFDFIEARRDPMWHMTNCSIVHQYHQNYSINYDGKYANTK